MPRLYYLLLWVLLVIVDQITKHWAAVSGKVFRNYNFAFSLPIHQSLMFTLYGAILGLMVGYILRRHRTFSRYEGAAWTLVLAGSLSNIAERIYLGFVRDFIYIGNGVFNIADFFILLGILLLLIVRSKPKHVS